MEGSGIGQFIPLILIFVIFYFSNKTSAKKVKEHKAMVEALKKETKLLRLVVSLVLLKELLITTKLKLKLLKMLKLKLLKQLEFKGF